MTMDFVRAVCPNCGEVRLPIGLVRLRFCLDTGEWAYAYFCYQCGQFHSKPAGKDLADLLVKGGVKVERWTMPLELAEPKLGPPITWDDVLDFHLELEGVM